MKYKPLPKQERIYYSDLVYAVTGETRALRKIKKLTPLFYSLAIADIGIDIAYSGLRKAGLLGRKK